MNCELEKYHYTSNVTEPVKFVFGAIGLPELVAIRVGLVAVTPNSRRRL
jgi:hypothetical protein